MQVQKSILLRSQKIHFQPSYGITHSKAPVNLVYSVLYSLH